MNDEQLTLENTMRSLELEQEPLPRRIMVNVSILKDTQERIARYQTVVTAARTLMSTFVRYTPDGNHSGELWWKPDPWIPMAKRDEALDALAAALEQEQK